MKNILILGDSHAEKLSYTIWYHLAEPNMNHKFEYSEQRYFKNMLQENDEYLLIHDRLTTYENFKQKIWVSSHPGRSAINFDYENFASGSQKHLLDKWNSEDCLVIPSFGYIDVRNWLPQHNIEEYMNAEQVVSAYVEKTLKKFNKAQVLFMEPNPQFITFITSNWAKLIGDPDNEFENRYEEHIKFVNALHNECSKRGLASPINVREILETDMIEPYMQNKKPLSLLLNDHMKSEYYAKISKYIIDNHFTS
jgi:hypothetical protein